MSRHNVGVPGTYQPTNLTYPPPSHSLPPILTCQGLFVILITAIHCTPHPHTATHTPSPIGPPNYTATHTQPTTAMLPPAWSTRESTSRAACGCNTTSAHHPSIHPRKPLRPPPTLPGCEPAPALFPPTSPHRGKRIPTGGGGRGITTSGHGTCRTPVRIRADSCAPGQWICTRYTDMGDSPPNPTHKLRTWPTQ